LWEDAERRKEITPVRWDDTAAGALWQEFLERCVDPDTGTPRRPPPLLEVGFDRFFEEGHTGDRLAIPSSWSDPEGARRLRRWVIDDRAHDLLRVIARGHLGAAGAIETSKRREIRTTTFDLDRLLAVVEEAWTAAEAQAAIAEAFAR
jgi:hypothetical protein